MKKAKINILIAEDSEDEIILIKEALEDSKLKNININYVTDGVEVMKYLHKQSPYDLKITPDLLLLDLNMPKKNGHEVLEEIKKDEKLRLIPVIILSTSQNKDDIEKSYYNHANCYISKPTDYYAFKDVVKVIEDYWINTAILPKSIDLD